MSVGELWTDASWTPGQWAHATNKVLADAGSLTRVGTRTPSRWITGRGPLSPEIRSAAAHALAQRLGRPDLTAPDLWPTSSRATHAVDEVDLSRPIDELLHTLTRPRLWSALSGIDLTATASDAARPREHHAHEDRDQHAPRRQLEALGDITTRLRELDDRHGGGELTVRMVETHLNGAVSLLRDTDLRYSGAERQSLLRIAADTVQLYGWLQYDAGRLAPAQQSMLRGIRAATEAGDDLGVINQLGMLAYMAANTGSPREAVQLAEHGCVLARSSPAIVRSRAAARRASAYAAAGDESRYREAAEEARSLQDAPSGPKHLYYYSPEQLNAEMGQALTLLNQHTAQRRTRQRLAAEAAQSLTPLAASAPDVSYQRSATLHGAHLALALLTTDDLEQAASAVSVACSRLDEVHSKRCRTLLRHARSAMLHREGNEWARSALTHLDAAGLGTPGMT